ncbi:metal-dependent hydrolase [Desulfonema magnum]|uniref:Metal-dependent hydrolase, LexA-binding n=1 Tax=Desulfonema magnum TaxID=45655 RepID=A0A975BRN7_9BACT|nr:metal-dependent hydrolase [Desulfonema magnum]QTA90381.1 Metal-dependent hydrolase, LexA-binding [Desulfonema magnum]
MPSFITHSIVGIAMGKTFAKKKTPKSFWFLSVFCAVFPDADVIGFYFHIPYSHFLGHRGFFHSPFFALLFSLFIVTIFFRQKKIFSKCWCRYVLYFFFVTASHGILDVFTNGGLGVALFSPFDNTRYFFPWTPIKVSPLSVTAFLSRRGLNVITSELLWIWLPLALSVILIRIICGLKFKNQESEYSDSKKFFQN